MASHKKDLKGTKVLITAGPTREYLDPVRFLSNPSTGRMGYAMAQAAARRGAQVLLISGPTALETPVGVKRIDVVSAAEMYRETLRWAGRYPIIIMTAAVADYRAAQVKKHKMKKKPAKSLQLKLVRTQDILAVLGQRKTANQYLVGFAAETKGLVRAARRKLEDKNLDLIVANPVNHGRGFAESHNEATLIFADGRTRKLARQSKARLAERILTQINLSRSALID